MRRAHDSVHTITGRYIHSTGRAIQFRIDMVSGVPLSCPKVEWFPLSQIEKTFRDPSKHDGDWLIVSGWILEQKNISIPTSIPVGESNVQGFSDSAYDDDIPF